MRPLSFLPALLVPFFLGIIPIVQEVGPQLRTNDCLELFSGERAITKNCLFVGLKAISFDLKDSTPMRPQDICTPSGMKTAVKEVLGLKPGGFLWAGPECKTWIFVARSGTHRTQFRAFGNKRVRRVSTANTMIVNLVMLLCLAVMLDVRTNF